METAKQNRSEAELRSQQPLSAKLIEEVAASINHLAFLRDFGPRSLAFRSAQALLNNALPPARKEEPKEPVHILVVPQLPPPAADASENEGLPTI